MLGIGAQMHLGYTGTSYPSNEESLGREKGKGHGHWVSYRLLQAEYGHPPMIVL